MENRYLLYAWKESLIPYLAGTFNDVILAFRHGEDLALQGMNYRIWDRNIPGWSRRLFMPKPRWQKEGF